MNEQHPLPDDQNGSIRSDRTEQGWWEESLSRREAGKRLAVIGAGAALLTSSGILIGCGDSDNGDVDLEEIEDAKAAIDVQKAEGWNVGADKTNLTFKYASATDSQNSLDWKNYTNPDSLRAAWTPAANQEFASTELINSLSQPTLQTSIQPVHSESMDEAYARGLGMKSLLESSKEPAGNAIVVDLPGPEAVAYAAALSDYANVVLTFDNWPHPNGVVPSQETLGALVYYAHEVEANKAKVKADAPTLFVMDSNRLVEYRDAANAFDNRYIVTMPTIDKLKAKKVTTVIYATPDDTRKEELDDLNDVFVGYREGGVNVTIMPLTDFRPASAEMVAEYGDVKDENSSTTVHRTYYYGGHPYFMPFFYSYYPITPFRTYNYNSLRTPPGHLKRPTYTPTRRPTMFSSATTGGKSGIGKQNVSGFGRVSTRTVNGKTTVTSASSRTSRSSGGSRSSSGRSGSFGRSGGRSSSG